MNLGDSWLEHKWVRCLDVVVQQFAWKNTSLALRQVELREFFFRAIQVGLGVVDVEH